MPPKLHLFNRGMRSLPKRPVLLDFTVWQNRPQVCESKSTSCLEDFHE